MALPQPGVWGIDLGQCALKAIRLENIDGEVTATAFDYIEHPKILSQPDADPDELTREALEQFLSRNTLKGDTVVISVPGQSGLARFVKLPPVEEKKIAEIVRFEAKQQIPVPLDEVVWDFQKVGQGTVTDGFAMDTEIGLFAMKRDMVNRYMQHFADVHVEVHFIQMAPLALCNFVSYDLLNKEGPSGGGDEEEDDSDKKQCIVALDIGTDNSNLIITDGEKIIWQRPIPLGGNHFTRALTKDLKLTFAKAEHLKRHAVKSPDLKKILSSLKPVLNDFVSEVQRSLGYFTNTHRDATIQFMVGLGNAFRLPGLQKYLQEKLQLEVRKLQSLERMTGDEVVAAPTFTENVLSFAVAYGLALQGLKVTRIQTNLLPPEIRFERQIKAKKPWAAAAAAALLFGVVGLTYGKAIEFKALSNPEFKKSHEQAKQVKQELEAAQRQFDEAENARQSALQSLRKLAAGVDEKDNWQLLYRYINLALPRPDRSNLGKEATRYGGDDALGKACHEAFILWQDKKYGKRKQLSPAEELKIKEYLVQVNIEGICSLYSDDLSAFYKSIAADQGGQLRGMELKEVTEINRFVKDSNLGALPKKGWLIEVRGFTYHKEWDDFLRRTFIANLRREAAKERVTAWLKERKPPDDAPKDWREKELQQMEERVLSKVGYFYMFKGSNDLDRVGDPEPGKFHFIKQSYLHHILGAVGKGPRDVAPPVVDPNQPPPPGKDGKNRDAWKALGLAASILIPGVPPGSPQQAGKLDEARPPQVYRTEFVLFFIWEELLTDAPKAAAAGQ
jgi:type IV pilus assembly protein PilM